MATLKSFLHGVYSPATHVFHAICPINPDNDFGPIISRACGRGFDLTLLFEQSILSIGPSAIVIFLSAIRLWTLHGKDKKTSPNYARAFKILATTINAALQLAVLLLWLLLDDLRNRSTIPGATIGLVGAVSICILSFFDHARSVRPSGIIAIYSLFSLIFDAFQARTLFLRGDSDSLVWTFTSNLIMKFVLLILESRSKRAYLKEPYRSLSPEEVEGVFNTGFLWWINPLIKTGYRKLLSHDDFPKFDSNLYPKPNHDLLQAAWDQRSKPEGWASLPLATLKAYKYTVLAGMPFRFLMIVFAYTQPFIISRAIRFVSEDVTETSKDVGTELVIAAFVVYFGIAVATLQYNIINNRLTIMLKGGMVGLIHNRSLTLQDGHYDESAAVTLMSTDTDNISGQVNLVWEIWAMVLELIIGLFLLYSQLGWIFIMPLVFVAIASRTSANAGKSIGEKQKAWSQATQKRIALTSSVLGSVKSLKMMGLSDLIETKVQDLRIEEIRVAAKFRWMIVYFSLAANSVIIAAPVGTLAAFEIVALIQGKPLLNTTQAFTSLALITMVGRPAQRMLALFPMVGSAAGCFSRIQKFLLDPSREDSRLGGQELEVASKVQKYADDENHVVNGTGNGHANFDGLQPMHLLDEPISELAVTLRDAAFKPATTAEIALENISIEIGKSSLCLIAGPVGCGKTTLAKGILGELPAESGEVEVCSKNIGYCSQSAWLSNGTIRQNICGPINDSEIDQKWYESVLNGCALERDLTLLNDGDRSVIGSRGIVLSGGQKQRVALARAVYARTDIVLLDDVLSALDAKTERLVVERLLGPKGLFRTHKTTVILITHSTQYFHLADHIVVIGTDKKIAEQGTFDHLRAQEGYISKLLVKEDHNDDPIEEEEHKMTTEKKSSKDPYADAAADLSRKTGDTAIYSYWLSTVGWQVGGSFVLANAFYAFCLTFPQFVLKWLTEDISGSHTTLYLLVYLLLAVGSSFTNAVAIALMNLVLGPRTSRALHEKLLHTVMRAPQSFFSSTDTGITLNRFSQDMSMVDRTLPHTALQVFMQGFKIIAQGFLLFSAQRFMLVTIPFVVGLVYIIQKVYLQTSRQLRFLDLEAKAPVYSHFLETLEGLSTIRAFGWQKQASAENITKLQFSLHPYYLLCYIQDWLSLILDFVVATLAVLVVYLAVSLRHTTSGGQIGIALNIVLSFNLVLLQLAEGYTQLETALGAISRLKNFNEQITPEDKPGEDFIPSDQWPEKGEIEFRNVTASYGPDALALRNLSMRIAPGQKVGVCGRTGSGKSTLLSSLLRLLDTDSGAIIIDGIDLRTLPRETIRTRMIAIPQDPFILSDSVRVNADPSGLLPDTTIISALTKVKLWSIIEPRGGLDENMKKEPLSQGQQQLFCLARAMLRTSKILILDEATSNVDRETDQMMQKIIREEFQNHTILTVAHRLDTILDADVVAVLDAGALVEFGNPKELLATEGSAFKNLHGH